VNFLIVFFSGILLISRENSKSSSIITIRNALTRRSTAKPQPNSVVNPLESEPDSTTLLGKYTVGDRSSCQWLRDYESETHSSFSGVAPRSFSCAATRLLQSLSDSPGEDPRSWEPNRVTQHIRFYKGDEAYPV